MPTRRPPGKCGSGRTMAASGMVGKAVGENRAHRAGVFARTARIVPLVLGLLAAAAVTGTNPAAAVGFAQSMTEWQAAMESRLAVVDAQAAQPVERVDPGPSLRPGDSGPRAAQLARRLVALGRLPAGQGRDTMDAVLVAAVKDFQTANGLTGEGVASAATLAAVNLSSRDEAAAIRATLSGHGALRGAGARELRAGQSRGAAADPGSGRRDRARHGRRGRP